MIHCRSLNLPCSARIASFDLADQIGTLTLAGGLSVRFGRSACHGFEPVPDADVIVHELAAHRLGGLRATRIGLDPSSTTYQALLARRDGRTYLTDPTTKAVGASHVLGWIVVLLDAPPPIEPESFVLWADGLGLTAQGVRTSAGDTLQMGIGNQDALAYVGDAPFPLDGLFLLDGVERAGRGFIGLSLGNPGYPPIMRSSRTWEDPWQPGGRLTDLTRLVLALLPHATAVVLPQARAVMTAQLAHDRLSVPIEADNHPFLGWISWTINDDERLYTTLGMRLHALPDVAIDVDPDDDESLDRGRSAILTAAGMMVTSNRILEARETISADGLRYVSDHDLSSNLIKLFKI
jgi:hypothetical protein